MKDWREGYIICEHVAEDKTITTRNRGFRVCCEECFEAGFLEAELESKKVRIEGKDGLYLCIGILPM